MLGGIQSIKAFKHKKTIELYNLGSAKTHMDETQSDQAMSLRDKGNT